MLIHYCIEQPRLASLSACVRPYQQRRCWESHVGGMEGGGGGRGSNRNKILAPISEHYSKGSQSQAATTENFQLLFGGLCRACLKDSLNINDALYERGCQKVPILLYVVVAIMILETCNLQVTCHAKEAAPQRKSQRFARVQYVLHPASHTQSCPGELLYVFFGAILHSPSGW